MNSINLKDCVTICYSKSNTPAKRKMKQNETNFSFTIKQVSTSDINPAKNFLSLRRHIMDEQQIDEFLETRSVTPQKIFQFVVIKIIRFNHQRKFSN